MQDEVRNISKTVMNWSSGKDAALAYYHLLQDERYDVVKLLTTVNAEQDRVVMHGVRRELLKAQAERLPVTIESIQLPAAPSDDVYKQTMTEVLERCKQEGITTAAFGDIFLEDLKNYREQQLATVGMEAAFPLWKKDTCELIQMVEQVGIEAVIVCVNANKLGKEFLGRKVDAELLNDLPDDVDPCGEYGEFHTFVYNAPFFSSAIPVKQGEAVHKTYNNEAGNWDAGFWFLDILPAD